MAGIAGQKFEDIEDCCNCRPPSAAGVECALNSQTSLGKLFSAGMSGNFSDLIKYPSLNPQISKDPSFTSAVFNSLLSHKSEDQALLVSPLPVQGGTMLDPCND